MMRSGASPSLRTVSLNVGTSPRFTVAVSASNESLIGALSSGRPPSTATSEPFSERPRRIPDVGDWRWQNLTS